LIIRKRRHEIELNARNDQLAFRIIGGTVRQMGLEIVD